MKTEPLKTRSKPRAVRPRSSSSAASATSATFAPIYRDANSLARKKPRPSRLSNSKTMAKLRELEPGEDLGSAEFLNSATTTTTATATTTSDDIGGQSPGPLPLPEFFIMPPVICDDLKTETSIKQSSTINECFPFLANLVDGDFNEHGVPHVHRHRHARFLRFFLGRLPAGFVGADSSRPWFLYWALASLTLLDEEGVADQYRVGVVETLRPMQNASGGFGSGAGQRSHLATTYGAVLALALVGGSEAYDLIDRRALWKWLGLLKCADGGFRMTLGGEEDIRGAYCAAVLISLLKLPVELPPACPAAEALIQFSSTPDLLSGLGEYASRCQTFEGGISGQPNAEAHGAYAFCALGCLAILDSPRRSIPKYLDVPRLIAWLSSRQYAPEGGMSGRTNKLVDGCYSHWIGGCWPLVEAGLNEPDAGGPETAAAREQNLKPSDASLYSREGLIRYILCCCQDTTKRGGLRDKPSADSDAYHTCYGLTGLSSAQHTWRVARPEFDATCGPDAVTAEHSVWTVEPCQEPGARIFDEEDRVPPVNPVYAIPADRVRDIRAFFGQKQGF